MAGTTAPDLKTLAVAGKGTVFSIQSGTTNNTGTVTTNGTAVTWVSGATFPTDGSWVGLTITINNVAYVIASVTDNHDLVLETTAGVQGTAVAFTVTTVAYTPVAELKTLDFSGSKNDIEDVSNFDSGSRFKEFIATMADAGDCSIAGNYVSTDLGQGAFRGAFNAGTVLSFTIQLPKQGGQVTKGDLWTFNAIVSELDNNIQYDKAITFSAKLKVTGPIAVTPGA